MKERQEAIKKRCCIERKKREEFINDRDPKLLIYERIGFFCVLGW